MDPEASLTPNEPSHGGGPFSGMLKDTVSGLGDNLRHIVRGEVALAKAELTEDARQVGSAGGLIVGSGMLGFTGFLFLMLGLIYLLGKKLPVWVSASLVGAVLVGSAGVVAARGKQQLQRARLKPEQTIASLRQDGDIFRPDAE